MEETQRLTAPNHGVCHSVTREMVQSTHPSTDTTSDIQDTTCGADST